MRSIGLSDIGGTITIHMFGAYFGIAASIALGKPQCTKKAEASKSSDVFSLVGTLFLWILWPAFNAAGAPMNSVQQARVILNTVLALTSSCVMSFLVSSVFFKPKIGPVDIQNATLAGGVMVGVTSNYLLYPGICLLSCDHCAGGAIAIGMIAGTVSVLGYNVVMLRMDHLVHDTCGVHNLHGMPSLAGAAVSIVMAAFASHDDYSADSWALAFPNGDSQWWHQMAGSLITLSFAIVTGYLTMAICKMIPSETAKTFRDKAYWASDYRK